MIKVIFNGPPGRARALAEVFREEGLDVAYDPPEERTNLGSHAMTGIDLYVASVTADKDVLVLTRTAVERFCEKFPKTEVEIDASEEGVTTRLRFVRPPVDPSDGSTGGS